MPRKSTSAAVAVTPEEPVEEPVYVRVVDLIEPETVTMLSSLVSVHVAPSLAPHPHPYVDYLLVRGAKSILAKRMSVLARAERRAILADTHYNMLCTQQEVFSRTAAEIVVEKYEADIAYHLAAQAADRAMRHMSRLVWRLRNFNDEYVIHPTRRQEFVERRHFR